MSTRVPTRRPVVTWPALLLGIGLIALAVVGLRDLAVSLDWTTGRSWTESVIDAVDGREASAVTTAVGVGVALVGLALVLTVLRPASRTHLRTPSEDVEVWISRTALSRLAEQAVERVPGAHSVQAVTRRRLSVRVRATEQDAEQRVHDALEQTVGGYLARPAKVSVRKATP